MPVHELPPIPNDPAHPLRRFVFRWVYDGHLDHSTWYGETHRDELHRLTRITRWPRRSTTHNRPMGRRYRFDGEEEELTYEEMIARLRQGETNDLSNVWVGQVQKHPLVERWQETGEEIAYTPSPPAFEPGSQVVRNFAQIEDPDLRQRLLEKRDRRAGMAGTAKEGNALYVLVDFGGKTGEQWVAAWKLDALTNAEATPPLDPGSSQSAA